MQRTAAVREKAPFRQTGNAGWVLLGGLVIAWDAAAPETMSNAFRRARGTPQGMVVLCTTWGLLTAHLFGILPREVDPFIRAGELAQVMRCRRIARECAVI